MNLADVLLPVPLPGLFTYAVPSVWDAAAQAGRRVIVPFGTKKSTTGIIVRRHNTPPSDPKVVVKDLIEVIDDETVVLPQQLALWQWISNYYLCSIGEVFKAALPGKLKKVPTSSRKRGETSGLFESIAKSRPSLTEDDGDRSLPSLSPAQSTALSSIHGQWEQHPVCLLHGVTSSGKTEIYIHLIAEAIARGEQVLYLLPEIVLTSQLTDRLRAVFGEHLGVYHSKFSDKERADVWMRQLSDAPYDIIVGVRSSIFLPFQRLGLVIVDEEHEVNFKQQEPAPRYNARNVAILMAARAGARTLLGTATPSFESYYNARMGKYGLVQLTERYGQVQLPDVEVIDVKELRRKRLMQGPFSPQLLEGMRAALDAGEQVILFQNRRGFAPQVHCHVCGWVPRCPHCDVPLTLHKRSGMLTCHYCGFTTPIPEQCPACETADLRGCGFGTERIEEELGRLFPQARVARMDLDTTHTRTAYEQILDDFAHARTDILVGTQMVTKGLDFERVSIVGILSAETMLNQPDFRAYERAFQMMAQVAGRAGRRQQRGRVLLQTMSADLALIRQLVTNDYEQLYQEQMLERREFSYPPFTRFVMVYMKHRSADIIDALARDTSHRLRAVFGSRVLGPDEPPVARIQGLFIRRVIIKMEPALSFSQARQFLLQTRTDLLAEHMYASAHIYFDVDPL